MSDPKTTECIVCFKPVPSDGCFMTCASCAHVYHLDACSGICDRTFRSMGSGKREKWNCRACRNNDSSISVGSANVAMSLVEGDTVSAQLAEINTKLELLYSLKFNVDRLCDLPAKVDDLLSLRPSVDAMKETIKGLQESVKKCESVMQLVTENDKEVKLLRSEVGSLKETMSNQSAVIEQLQTNINSTEQYSRRFNMEIHGIPCAADEDLSVTVNSIALQLKIESYNPSQVVACHRLRSRRDAAPPILIQFTSVAVKEQWMNARKKLAMLPRSGNQQKVYFNENLTRINKELFWQARTKAKEKSYKFVWVKNGSIFEKKNETSTLVRIFGSRDLEKII